MGRLNPAYVGDHLKTQFAELPAEVSNIIGAVKAQGARMPESCSLCAQVNAGSATAALRAARLCLAGISSGIGAAHAESNASITRRHPSTRLPRGIAASALAKAAGLTPVLLPPKGRQSTARPKNLRLWMIANSASKTGQRIYVKPGIKRVGQKAAIPLN